MMNSKDKVLYELQKSLCLKGKICVALSGGADSVCLLHSLSVLSKTNGFELSAVHINHHLRGAESDRDEDFCKSLCEKLNVPLAVNNVYVLDQMQSGESVELAARRFRYEVFEKCDADFIATAHNADDSLETFIINFSRGSGLKGLCGIPQSRGRFLRPLLSITKQEILDYCKQNDLSFVTDSSNLSDDYTRNKIRHHILPELEKLNTQIHAVAIRNFELLKADNDFLEKSAEELYKKAFDSKKGISADVIKSAHSAISARVLMNYCYSVTKHYPDALHIKQLQKLCFEQSGEIGLFADYRAVLKKGWLLVFKTENISISVDTELISAEKYQNCLKINNLLLKNAIDYDKIVGKLELRTRLPQDSMKPAGRGVTKPIRRLQAEADVYKAHRPFAPVAADDNGVVWAYGVGISERVKIDQNTEKVLIFKVYQEENRGQ